MSILHATPGNVYLDLGFQILTTQGSNACRLGTNLMSGNASLDIVGAGAGNARAVTLWDNVYVPGDLIVSGNTSASGGSLTNLNASAITTGTLANPRLPSAIDVSTVNANSSVTTATVTASGNVNASQLAASGLAYVGGALTAPAGTTTDVTGNLTSTGNITTTANVTASSAGGFGFFGNGRNLTSLSATNVDSGTLNTARLPTTITGIASLTAVALVGDVSGNLTSTGNITTTANVTASSAGGFGFFGNGRNVTSLSATNVDSGTLNNARLPTNVDVSGTLNANGATTLATATMTGNVNASQVAVSGNTYIGGTLTAAANITTTANVTASSAVGLGFFGNGRNLTSLSATNVDAGTLPNARLPTTITGITSLTATSLVGDHTGNTTAAGNITTTANVTSGSGAGVGFFGNGRNITNLTATNIDSGTLNNARLPTNHDIAGTLNANGATTLATATMSGNVNASQLAVSGISYIGGVLTAPAGTTTNVTGNLTATGNVTTTANVTSGSGAGVGFYGNGRNITSLTATNIDFGTLNNARLPTNHDIAGTLNANGATTLATATMSGNVNASQLAVSGISYIGGVLTAPAGTTTNVTGNLTATGNVTTTANVTSGSGAGVGFYGNGRNITSLTATNIDFGTLNNARLPTNHDIAGTLNANGATTLATATMSGNVNASQLAVSGISYIGGVLTAPAGTTTNVTGNLTSTGNVTTTANVTASSAAGLGFFGNGRNITSLSATNVDTGTLNNARLPTNVNIGGTLNANGTTTVVDVTLGGNITLAGQPTFGASTGDGATYAVFNNFVGSWYGLAVRCSFDSTVRHVFNTRNGNLDMTGTCTAAAFSGDGSLLSGLSATNVSSGQLANARLPTNVDVAGTLNANGTVTFSGNVSMINSRILTLSNTGVGTQYIDTLNNNSLRLWSYAPNNGGLISFLSNATTVGLFSFDGLSVTGNASATKNVNSAQLSVSGIGYVNNLVGSNVAMTGCVSASAFTAGTGQPVLISPNQSEKVRIDVNGNVGIGNSAPAHKLSVEGTSYLNGAVTATGSLTAATFSGSGASLTALAADQVSTGQLNNARLPSAISVATSLQANSTITLSGTSTFNLYNDAGILFTRYAAGQSSSTEYFISRGGTSPYAFGNVLLIHTPSAVTDAAVVIGTSGGVVRLKVDSVTGNVGIGNSAPAHKLAVNGTAYASGNAQFLSNVHIGTVIAGAYLPSTPLTVGINSTDNQAAGNTFGTVATFMRTDGNRGNVGIALLCRSQGAYSIQLNPTATGNHLVFLDNRYPEFLGAGGSTGSERMRIDSSGNVGIANTAPVHKLSVEGTSYLNGAVTATGSITAAAGNLNASQLAVSGASYLGGAATFGGDVVLNNPSVGYITRNAAAVGTGNLRIEFIRTGGGSLHSVAFTSNLVTCSGNIGIGTTGPAYQLQLSTDSAAKPTTSTWTIASDRRVKQDIENANIDLCYSTVRSLPLRRYAYDPVVFPDDAIRDRRVVGWIAQEVEAVLPKAVSQSSQYGYDDFLSLDADQLYKTMYGALQKVISVQEALEARVAALEN
jgi:hypothetical protein